MKTSRTLRICSLVAAVLLPVAVFAQSTVSSAATQSAGTQKPATTDGAAAVVPGDYVIGVEDVLGIVFWREQDKALSTDAVVRPDGMISVPMLNDIPAAGLTPEALAKAVEQAAAKFIRDSAATVIVRAINSRKVHVIGEVSKPGPVALGGQMTILQLISEVGGFTEIAKKSDVTIVRTVKGKEQRFKFNYKEVVAGKKIEQNILLRPGDVVLVR
jgi:polysaccharide biosynthesis/export protein